MKIKWIFAFHIRLSTICRPENVSYVTSRHWFVNLSSNNWATGERIFYQCTSLRGSGSQPLYTNQTQCIAVFMFTFTSVVFIVLVNEAKHDEAQCDSRPTNQMTVCMSSNYMTLTRIRLDCFLLLYDVTYVVNEYTFDHDEMVFFDRKVEALLSSQPSTVLSRIPYRQLEELHINYSTKHRKGRYGEWVGTGGFGHLHRWFWCRCLHLA